MKTYCLMAENSTVKIHPKIVGMTGNEIVVNEI